MRPIDMRPIDLLRTWGTKLVLDLRTRSREADRAYRRPFMARASKAYARVLTAAAAAAEDQLELELEAWEEPCSTEP